MEKLWIGKQIDGGPGGIEARPLGSQGLKADVSDSGPLMHGCADFAGKPVGCLTVTGGLPCRILRFGRFASDHFVGFAGRDSGRLRASRRLFCCDHQENCDKLPDPCGDIAFSLKTRQLTSGCSEVDSLYVAVVRSFSMNLRHSILSRSLLILGALASVMAIVFRLRGRIKKARSS